MDKQSVLLSPSSFQLSTFNSQLSTCARAILEPTTSQLRVNHVSHPYLYILCIYPVNHYFSPFNFHLSTLQLLSTINFKLSTSFNYHLSPLFRRCKGNTFFWITQILDTFLHFFPLLWHKKTPFRAFFCYCLSIASAIELAMMAISSAGRDSLGFVKSMSFSEFIGTRCT